MNQTLIFALFVMAMLIVVCVGYSASQAWRSLLVEQRLNQIKGSGDSRLVRWEDLLTLIARPLRRSRDLAAVERSMQQAGFIKPWQTDLFLLFRALVLIAAAVGGWLAIRFFGYTAICYASGLAFWVNVYLTEGQYVALMSLAYNIGVDGVVHKCPKLMRAVNAGDAEEAARQFLDVNKANGKVLPGLTRRRQAEAKLYLGEE